MAVESPICVRVLGELPRSDLNTAAFFVLMSLSLWIESPVIDLLSTATTFARNRQHYVLSSRFVLYVLVWVTAIHALLVFTPLYFVITDGLLRLPKDVSAAARPGLMVMLPWSALIGWRRSLQGVLIRYGQTRLVGFGTAVRVAAMASSASILLATTKLPGVVLVSVGLIFAVGSEAAFIHWASRKVVRKEFLADADDGEPPLTMLKLVRFHFPLTATTMVNLCGPPIIGAALARSPAPILALAAYQVAQTLIWLHRTITFALPEVVITLYRDAQSALKLRRFSIAVGAATSGMLFLTALSGADRWFFGKALEAEPKTTAMAHLAFLYTALVPFIGALLSYVRGMLAAHHLTVSRLWAMGVGITTLIVALEVGVAARWVGVISAAIALTVASLAELGVLGWAWRRGAAGRTEDTFGALGGANQ